MSDKKCKNCDIPYPKYGACPICGSHDPNSQDISEIISKSCYSKKHESSSHTIFVNDSKETRLEERKMLCQFCGQEFSNEIIFQKHMGEHDLGKRRKTYNSY